LEAGGFIRNLKDMKGGWLVFVMLTVPLALLMSISSSCLAPLAIALITFGIPYLFGVRSIKTMLKTGTVVIILTGILTGVMWTHFLYNQMFVFEERTLANKNMVNGTVTPYLGDEETLFNYTVVYRGSEEQSNLTIYVNITDWGGGEEKSISLYRSGSLYYKETTLDSNFYYYRFSLYSNGTGNWSETDPGTGPVNIEYSGMMGTQILYGLVSMFLGAGLFFYMVVILYHWRRSMKEERGKWKEELKSAAEEIEEDEEEMEEEVDIEEGEYECTECGATVNAEAEVCPQCGESFDEEEEEGQGEPTTDKDSDKKALPKENVTSEIYTCTECGADVKGDDTVCPGCGEPFED
jgi:RNA polymerase subunit RPABC4/transcription elongation factor Spt4